MAFPLVIVECAFAGEEDESLYATGGWSDITTWVRSVSGPLRGRSYELNKVEAGSLSVTLDNLDGRFTPNTLSPYWPGIEPNKRFRIRGKNMVAPNVARGGGKDHSAQNFEFPDFDAVANPTYTTGFNYPPVWLNTTGGVTVTGITDHMEVTVSTGATGVKRIFAWLAPVEVATRLLHSAYVHLVSGTEPASTNSMLELYYFDNDGNSIVADQRPTDTRSGTSTSVATRYAVSHAPFGTVKSMLVVFSVSYATATTVPIVYGLTGAQSELPTNLAPQISAQFDTVHWRTTGTANETITRETTTGTNIAMVWNGSDNLFQRIPHLIPGDAYSVAVEVFKSGAGPDIFMTADDGQTGATLNVESTWTTLRTTFVADGVTQDIKFIPQASAIGKTIKVRGLRVEHGTNLSLPIGTGLEVELTTWERPLDVFEGWVESWPWNIEGGMSSITVNDRIQRIGGIELANTLPESLDQDSPDAVFPFNDVPNAAAIEWSGNWADAAINVAQVPIQQFKTVTGASYTLGIEGPTDDPAIDWNPSGALFNQGYFLEVPYNRVAVVVPVTPPTPPTPPPPPKTTYSYTWKSTWSRTFDSDGSTRFDDSAHLYQGDYDGSHGNQRALVGFNWSDMRARLAGAQILGVWFNIHNLHWRWNAGQAVRLGTHVYTSKPGTWSQGSVRNGRWAAWVNEGTSIGIAVGAGVGYEFRDGTANGMAVGPGLGGGTPQDDYGYFSGATDGSSPSITIQYRK